MSQKHWEEFPPDKEPPEGILTHGSWLHWRPQLPSSHTASPNYLLFLFWLREKITCCAFENVNNRCTRCQTFMWEHVEPEQQAENHSAVTCDFRFFCISFFCDQTFKYLCLRVCLLWWHERCTFTHTTNIRCVHWSVLIFKWTVMLILRESLVCVVC